MNNFEIIHHEICRRYIGLFRNCPTISQHLPAIIDRITAKDVHGQVTLLPYFFRGSLSRQYAKKISENFVTKLGIANLAGWVAYRICDDFMDNEGNPELLPVATVSMRYCMALYREFLPMPVYGIFESFMDRMDENNARERHISYKPKTLPDYADYAILGYKSLPHCLGPVAILMYLGYATDSPEIKRCVSFFYHYLIARQLSDDALDWQKDLDRGFVNPVGTKILGGREKNEVFREIVSEIRDHISRAESELNKNNAIVYKEYLQSLLDKLRPSTS